MKRPKTVSSTPNRPPTVASEFSNPVEKHRTPKVYSEYRSLLKVPRSRSPDTPTESRSILREHQVSLPGVYLLITTLSSSSTSTFVDS